MKVVKSERWLNKTDREGLPLSDRTGLKNSMYGKTHSEETKAKLRKPKSEEHKAKLRKPKSEEHKRKLSEANLGEKHPRFGKTLSDEHKKKISETKRRKIQNNVLLLPKRI